MFHAKNIYKNVLGPSTSRSYAMDVKCFILHVTTSYLQLVFKMLNISKNVVVFYYRAMHVVYRLDYSSKLITRIIRLGSSLLGVTTSAI